MVMAMSVAVTVIGIGEDRRRTRKAIANYSSRRWNRGKSGKVWGLFWGDWGLRSPLCLDAHSCGAADWSQRLVQFVDSTHLALVQSRTPSHSTVHCAAKYGLLIMGPHGYFVPLLSLLSFVSLRFAVLL